MKKPTLKDGFYFVLNIKTDLITIVSIHNETDIVGYHGIDRRTTIEEFEKEIKNKKYKLIDKIKIPKISKVS